MDLDRPLGAHHQFLPYQLTGRESEIVRLVALGKTNAEGSKYTTQVQEVQDKISSGEITDIPDTVK